MDFILDSAENLDTSLAALASMVATRDSKLATERSRITKQGASIATQKRKVRALKRTIRVADKEWENMALELEGREFEVEEMRSAAAQKLETDRALAVAAEPESYRFDEYYVEEYYRRKEAETRAMESETRALEADAQVEDAESRAEYARSRAEYAKSRAGDAKARAKRAEFRARAAICRADQAEIQAKAVFGQITWAEQMRRNAQKNEIRAEKECAEAQKKSAAEALAAIRAHAQARRAKERFAALEGSARKLLEHFDGVSAEGSGSMIHRVEALREALSRKDEDVVDLCSEDEGL